MPSKTIGPAGARLLTALAERERTIFSVAEAQAVIGGDYDAVVHTLRRLERAGWVVRLTAGRYALVPLSSGSAAAPQVNRYVIMRELLAPEPYYISHDSAMDIHHMLTRPVTVVTATSPRRLAGRTILGIPYRFVYAPPAALWGHAPTWVTPYEIEKDYVLTWKLLAVADSRLRDHLAFKGGTALKKVYVPEYRFSEDLDFTLLADLSNDDLVGAVEGLFAWLQREVNITLAVRRLEVHPTGNPAIYLNYTGPLGGDLSSRFFKRAARSVRRALHPGA